MKFIKLTAFILMLGFAVGVTDVHAFWWNRGGHQGEDKMDMDGPPDDGMGMMFGGKSQNENFLALMEVIGVDSEIEAFSIEVQMIFLEFRSVELELKEERNDLWDEIADLSEDYNDGDELAGDLIYEKMSEIIEIQKEINDIKSEAMDSIHQLSVSMEEKVMSAVDEWLISAEPGTEEFDELISTMADF